MKRKNLQLPSWARVLPMMLCMVVLSTLSIKAQGDCILPLGKNVPWQMKYQLLEESDPEPANDVNGKSWKDLTYDDSSWGMLTGPLGRAAYEYVQANYEWDGDYKAFYLRRPFNLTSTPQEDATLCLLQDDAIEVYINGTLVTEVPGWRDEWLTYSIPANVFVSGNNILAIRYTTVTVPDYLDYGLYIGAVNIAEEYNVLREDGTCLIKTFEGVTMTLKVIDEDKKWVQVGNGIDPSVSQDTAGAVTIPNKVVIDGETYTVVGIGDYGFYNCDKLTAIWLPESLQFIGRYAFYGCKLVGKIQIPETVYAIDNTAFEGCTGLTEFSCPYIDGFTYPSCPVTIIGYKASDEDYDVVIPQAVTSIGERAFSLCATIRTMRVEEGNTVFDSRNNCNAIIRTADNVLLFGCKGTSIPESVSAIDAYAFEGHTGLTTIAIPAAVASIGEGAFIGCTGLTAVTSNILQPYAINDNTFSASTYQTATLYVPYGKKSLYQAADGWKNFQNISEMVEEEEMTLEYTDPTSNVVYVYTTTGTTAKVKAGNMSNWTSGSPNASGDVVILDKITVGGKQYTVNEMGDLALYGCNIRSITIPATIERIGKLACNGWYLTNVTVLGSQPAVLTNNSCFSEVTYQHATLSLPVGTEDVYFNANGWKEFFSYVKKDGIVYHISSWDQHTAELAGVESNFNGSLDISPSIDYKGEQYIVTKVMFNAFHSNSDITEVIIPASMQLEYYDQYYDWRNIDNPFSSCVNLNTITVAEENPLFDSRNNCNAIIETETNELLIGCNTTVIPDNIVTIARDAFYGATFTEITIPASVQRIGDIAFGHCNNLNAFKVLNETPCSLDEGVFNESSHNVFQYATLYVPKGCKAAYETADVWKNFTNIVEMEEEINPDAVINFADAEVKRICVENWDTSGDGELSYAEAAAVTEIDLEFYNSNIVTFEEFQYFTGLTKISGYYRTKAEDGDYYIGHQRGFAQCKNLEKITIPNTIEVIESYAFNGDANLQSIILPDGLCTIGEESFRGCRSLTEITIPESVGSIGSHAFCDCFSISSIFIPKNVRYVGSGITNTNGKAFASIVVDSDNPYYDSRDNCNAIIRTATNTLVSSGSSTVIPSSVTSIEAWALYGHDDIEIVIPDQITTIGWGAYGGYSNLKKITLPASATTIDGEAFRYAHKLEEVYAKMKSPVSINSNVFNGSLLENVTLYVPFGSKPAYEAADVWKDFKEIIEMEPDPNAFIDFADAEVKRICVENWDCNEDGELSYSEAAAVTDLGQVFKSNRTIELFEELQYFTGLTTLPECAFQNCMNLLKVRLPRTIITIEHSVFENCYKLTDVTLHEGIESIDWAAFSGCRSITSVTIPASTTSLSSNPFSHCYILSEVSVAEGNPVYDSRNNCNAVIETATNKLVMGCNNSIIPEGIVELGSLAFAGYKVLTSIELPSTLKILDNQVFIDCSSLTSIDLKNVTDIGYACFGGTPLTIVHIPSTVERIDFSNPFGHSTIESITVDPSNPYYDSRDNCNAIIAKNFTNTILRDGKKAVNVLVSGCKNTIIPSSVRAIGDDAFKYCKMNTIDIPEGVESILYGAFMHSEIQTIKLPKSLTFLDEGAFWYCNQLATVTVQNAVPLSIASSTFNTRSSITLYVPYGSKAAYEAADVWKEFKEIVEVKPDNFLYASEATVRLGDKKTIALQLDNTESLIAAEFRLQLPAGLTIEKDENNNLVAAIVGDRRINHTLTVTDEGNGLYHFLSYSNPIRAYKGNSGDFITLSIVSDGSMEEGTYTATLKGIIFSDENEQKLTFDDCSFNISVINYTTGDANGDGSIDVMDVVKMVSHIMGRNPSSFNQIAADIDGNGKVNVMDLVNLINLIMSTPQQTSGIAPHAQSGSMELSRNGDEAITVSIPFADRHVAAQFVVSVTDGAVLQEVVADEAHQSKFTRMSDGRYKVMVFSGNNATFNSNSPIKLQLSGNGDVKIEDAMFVDIDEEAVAFESAVLNTTGITAVGTTFAHPVDIYTVGGKLLKSGATSTQGLAKGVYVVNNQKLIVK